MGRVRGHARGVGRRGRLVADRQQVVRARRPHGELDHRRRPHAGGREPVHLLDARRRRVTRPPCRPWIRPASRPARVRRDAGAVDRSRRRAGRARPCSTTSPCSPPSRWAGRPGARHGRRVRQGARSVRPADRVVSGDQAQVRRHAARGRVGAIGGLLRAVGGAADERRGADGRHAGQGLLRGGLPPRARRRTSRSTAGSASPGSTPRTYTSSGRRTAQLLLGDPTSIGSGWPTSSVSDRGACVTVLGQFAAAPETQPGKEGV